MNSFELTFSITAIASALAKELTDSELALLSSVFVQLGDTLATISAKRSFEIESEQKKEYK